jgi:hypothetical protein
VISRTMSNWQTSELRRPRHLIPALVALALSAAGVTTASCNVHELSHLVVSKIMGLDVLWVQWCRPGSGGEVKLAEVSPPLQAFAGGIGAAVVPSAFYAATFVRLELPYRSPMWYAVGLPILPLAALQFLVGILEGASLRNYGGDYGAMINSMPTLFVPLIIVVILAGLGGYITSWRRVFRLSQAL